jgi:LPS export ABC transporter protein LptC
MAKGYSIVFITIAFLIQFSCKDSADLKRPEEYKGPKATFDKVETLFSDSAIVRIRLTAPKQIEEQNGNLTYPKGIKVEFFEKDNTLSSQLTANSATYDKTTGVYTAIGNVVVVGKKDGNELKTEKLHWNPETKKVYTDVFVTIKEDDTILYGDGLIANEDFSYYKITFPKGTIYLDEEEEEEDSSDTTETEN